MRSAVSDYEVYGAADQQYDAPSEGDGPWVVVIEFSNGGQAKPPTKLQFGKTIFPVRADALAAAQRAAFEFAPPDPWAIKGRDVFRDGPEGFLVVLRGATSTFHMSVRLVQPVAAPQAASKGGSGGGAVV